MKRRSFLIGIIGALAGSATTIALTPLLQRLTGFWINTLRNPKTVTNTEVNLSSLRVGETMAADWNGNVIYILHRTPEMIAEIENDIPRHLADPNSETGNNPLPKNSLPKFRSLTKKFLVVNGMCTHVGCPTEPVISGQIPRLPTGGFYCACHGGMFDAAGRVLTSVPPPQNLFVPPHYFKDEHTLVIGEYKH